MAEPVYWTPKQAAAYVNVSLQTMYDWLNPAKKRGNKAVLVGEPPPYRRFGRQCIRIPVEEFKQWAKPKQGKS